MDRETGKGDLSKVIQQHCFLSYLTSWVLLLLLSWAWDYDSTFSLFV